MTIVVVPTGSANIASVLAAFRRLGVDAELAGGPDEVVSADRVVLPGVGSFGAASDEVDRSGQHDALAERVSSGRPTLAICVGMQLLARASDESAGSAGLGVLDDEVRQFPGSVRVPQLGWNRVMAGQGCRFVDDGWAYFANSYRIEAIPAGWDGAISDHGGEFVAALERGDVLACQFHPELSGPWGSAVLDRWLGRSAA